MLTVYNGALCSDMTKEREHTKALEARMKIADKTASCTYFPAEGMFLVFINSNSLDNPNLVGPPKELTGVMYVDKQVALIEAIKVLEERNSER